MLPCKNYNLIIFPVEIFDSVATTPNSDVTENRHTLQYSSTLLAPGGQQKPEFQLLFKFLSKCLKFGDFSVCTHHVVTKKTEIQEEEGCSQEAAAMVFVPPMSGSFERV